MELIYYFQTYVTQTLIGKNINNNLNNDGKYSN